MQEVSELLGKDPQAPFLSWQSVPISEFSRLATVSLLWSSLVGLYFRQELAGGTETPGVVYVMSSVIPVCFLIIFTRLSKLTVCKASEADYEGLVFHVALKGKKYLITADSLGRAAAILSPLSQPAASDHHLERPRTIRASRLNLNVRTEASATGKADQHADSLLC
ncbi:hypothetical protein SRHO_G00151770 [Serrasalmus rhombeus]